MNQSIFIGLLQNIAILLALGMLYDYFWAKDEKTKSLGFKLLGGIIIGAVGVILILTPWTLVPGLVFDTRSVMLSISGLFFGPIPTIIAMVITGGYRIMVGGDGMWMGVAVIISSGSIGILWRTLRPQWRNKRYMIELLSMGLLVHIMMLGCTLLLPGPIVWTTLKTIFIPVIVIYPAGTMLLGALMIKQTENWATRKALQRSEERWHFALEGAGDGVWDWNPQTGEVFYSKRWKEMLGYTDAEITNNITEWDDRVHPDDRDAAYKDLDKHISGEIPVYINIHRLRCKDGTYSWILDRGKVMNRDEEGMPVRFIGTHTNITDRKIVEEELTFAKLKAEESDRLKMSFLNNISHEVRTPLNAIMGFTTLLSEEEKEDDRKRFGKIINSNANQLLSIIDDVLEFSRLETESVVFEKQSFSVTELLDELYHAMKPFADEKKLQWSCESLLDKDMEMVKGDRSRIRQVISCFISNALNYTLQGSVGLRVEEDGGTLRFAVRDTGIGLEKADHQKVFERFYRAPGAQKLATRGTGLGLSIAKQLVEIMGGTIGVISLSPDGSEFYFRLSLERAEGQTDIIHSEEPFSDISGIHVLIAEDEEDNFEFLRVLLSKKVAKLSRARNGAEVLEILKTTSPDLILMDLKMPVMDGYQATREIRKTDSRIPIVALTAYSQSEEKKLAVEAGCTSFVSKPVQKVMLFAEVRRALSGR
ncbi:MAG: response regulator [Bacteroidales bacterium]|nr:response regulator [Bacteroidales bacterium]